MEKEIKQEVNKIIKNFVYRPWTTYPKFITKNEVDVVSIENDKAIRLSCRTWQDNDYYDFVKELVKRARLDLDIYGRTEKGGHLYMSSQVRLCEEPDEIYRDIQKTITAFNEINSYHKKREQLAKESADISPGSPMDRLNEEFYGKIEELMLK